VSADRLRERLAARGRDWPGGIESFPVLDSTNEEVRARARAGTAAPWLAVIAERQTEGRGRRGRSWASPHGNLYVSLLAPMPTLPDARPLVPLIAGLAVAEALLEFGVEPRLKWPNDVLCGGRKLAGVSAEASFAGGEADAVVLGIGVNVRVNPLGDLATSVLELTGEGLDPLEVAAAVLIRLRDRHLELRAGGSSLALHAWRARSIEWWGRPVEVTSGEQALRGIAVGVDEGGALILELPDGRRQTVVAGEARELRLGGR
jgi:BirA family biotin operon repressor/biotin-[acetyl-CoA-carboxylase] ligase